MSLHDRIKEARKNKGITQERLGELIGVAKTTIAGYEKNREPTAAKVGEIADALDVDVNFLFQDEVREFHSNRTTSIELEYIKKYRLIDQYDKETVVFLLDIAYKRYLQTKTIKQESLNSANKVKESAIPCICNPETRIYPEGVLPIDSYQTEDDEDDTRISMPVYDLGASAGTGVFLDNPCYEMVSVPEDRLSRKANFALWVSGNSMEPRFHNGDLVLVKIQPAVEIGEIGIFILNGEGYIKKWGGDKLISLNNEYDPIEIGENDTLYCKGKVIGNA